MYTFLTNRKMMCLYDRDLQTDFKLSYIHVRADDF